MNCTVPFSKRVSHQWQRKSPKEWSLGGQIQKYSVRWRLQTPVDTVQTGLRGVTDKGSEKREPFWRFPLQLHYVWVVGRICLLCDITGMILVYIQPLTMEGSDSELCSVPLAYLSLEQNDYIHLQIPMPCSPGWSLTGPVSMVFLPLHWVYYCLCSMVLR